MNETNLNNQPVAQTNVNTQPLNMPNINVQPNTSTPSVQPATQPVQDIVSAQNTIQQIPQPQIKTIIPMEQAPSEVNTTTSIPNVPTIEQSREEFISNTQSVSTEKKEEKKEGINYALLIGLFVGIFLIIKFLFPILLRYI